MSLLVILIASLVFGATSLQSRRIVRCRLTTIANSLVPSEPSDLEVFIRTSIVNKSKEELRYSSSPKYGGHISREYFAYEQRFTESDYIASLFRYRQVERLNTTNIPEDKICNPLVSLPGSPGSGKTTFLVHFPEHYTYRDYVRDSDLVLVSTLTFNSGMEYGNTSLGLRIVFGLLKSMGLLQHYPSLLSWYAFYTHFIAYKALTGYDSVKMLNSIFLEMYPNATIKFLILIDELSKSLGCDGILKNVDEKPNIVMNYKKFIYRIFDISFNDNNEPNILMKDIGSILNKFGNVDVIVSSLSPYFIYKLLTGSQRPIRYVIPKPLLGYPLGMDKYKAWVSRLCTLSKISTNDIDETQVKIIKNFYLLYSGHPRSLQFFCKLCEDKTIDWKNIIDSLRSKYDIIDTMDPSQSYVTFLNELIDAIRCSDNYQTMREYSLEDANYLNKYIFSNVPIVPHDNIARDLLERNLLMLYKRVGENFIFMTPTITLLKWLNLHGNAFLWSKKLQKVQLLVREFDYLSISELWEYIIAISILCHSHDYRSLKSIFGFSKYGGLFVNNPRFKILYDKNTEGWKWSFFNKKTASNTIHMPIRRQKGFDLRVVMKNIQGNNISGRRTHHLYLQCKVGLPKKERKKSLLKRKKNTPQSLSKILANVIYYSVRHFLNDAKRTDLAELHIGLYIWADLNQTTLEDVTRESLQTEIRLFEKKGVKKGATKADMELKKELIADAVLFIDKYFSHIHILDKKGIEEWLLPSFLSIPYFIQAVNEQ